MGALYYLNPSDGVMMTNCTIDGRRLDGSGAYRE
jgi:glucan-binding YG repeat protein